MSSSIPPGAVPVGSKLYFFKSKTNSTDALISAHGGYHKGNNTFKVPSGVEIIFYGIHGNLLQDPGIKLASTKNVVAVETVTSGGNCVDYVLSKYQGSHGGTAGKPAETYSSINKQLEADSDMLTRQFEALFSEKLQLSPKKQEVVQKTVKNILTTPTMNVVTIRNRWNMVGGDIYLKDVIKAVTKQFPGIKRFHCSFCRGLIGDDNAGTSVLQVGAGW